MQKNCEIHSEEAAKLKFAKKTQDSAFMSFE